MLAYKKFKKLKPRSIAKRCASCRKIIPLGKFTCMDCGTRAMRRKF